MVVKHTPYLKLRIYVCTDVSVYAYMKCWSGGAWVTQWVKRRPLAQVMIPSYTLL